MAGREGAPVSGDPGIPGPESKVLPTVPKSALCYSHALSSGLSSVAGARNDLHGQEGNGRHSTSGRFESSGADGRHSF